MKYSALFVTLNGKFADMYGEFRRDVGHFLAVSECDLGVPKSVAIATKLQRAPSYQRRRSLFLAECVLKARFLPWGVDRRLVAPRAKSVSGVLGNRRRTTNIRTMRVTLEKAFPRTTRRYIYPIRRLFRTFLDRLKRYAKRQVFLDTPDSRHRL